MKKYNESAMMQKMSLKEMNDVNGGNPVAIKAAEFLLGHVVGELLDRGAGDDFWEGWNDAKKNK